MPDLRSPPSSRRELAAFLRSRRARLSPLDVGMPPTQRRRTPGLRREEVAQLAGIGVTWYTWLEQGRAISVSSPFLENVARALRLDPAERAHLFALAQHRPPPVLPVPSSRVTPALRHTLETIPNPAYVKTARWDVLAWNTAMSAVLGDPGLVPAERRNMLWLVFASADHRRMMPDWADDARAMLAKFRLEFSRAGDDPAFAALVRELGDISPEFHRWWAQHDVMGRGEGIKRFQHPTLGEIRFEHTSFIVEDAPDLRLVIYAPIAGASARKVMRAQVPPRRAKRPS